MQHVDLAGQADPLRTAISERLHALGRDADAIRDMSMRCESPVGEADRHALQTVGSGAEANRTGRARSFKMPGLAAA
jgi:hypothetical protein